MIVIGIDGGLTGAVAFLSHARAVVEDIPTVPMEGGAITRRVHGPSLRTLIRQHCPIDVPILVVIEELSTGGMGRGNAMAVGSQFRTRGTIECVLEMLGLDVQAVTPQRWKKMYGLVGDRKSLKKPGKKDSLAMARELYPELGQTSLRLALHHNRAEAVLIAHWARKVLA
jgi:hypothetical protein